MPDIPDSKLTTTVSACREVLRALVKFAVGAGLKYPQLDELLRETLIEEAKDLAKKSGGRDSNVSLLAAITGLNRKDLSSRVHPTTVETVKDLASSPSRIFTAWLHWARIKPDLSWLPIESQEDGYSFEQLSDAHTKKNVHHRVMLDELCRLGMASKKKGYVVLQTDGFVPKEDWQEMVAFLGANTSDHLRAATANVLSEEPRFLERSIFVNGISTQAGQAIQHRTRAAWNVLHDELYSLMDEAQKNQAFEVSTAPSQRMRVGIYVYLEDESDVNASKTAAVEKQGKKP